MLATNHHIGHKMIDTIPSASLRARTLDLVTNAPRSITYTTMARECGLSVAWVSRFARDEIPNPGVDYVQCLHDYLVRVCA